MSRRRAEVKIAVVIRMQPLLGALGARLRVFVHSQRRWFSSACTAHTLVGEETLTLACTQIWAAVSTSCCSNSDPRLLWTQAETGNLACNGRSDSCDLQTAARVQAPSCRAAANEGEETGGGRGFSHSFGGCMRSGFPWCRGQKPTGTVGSPDAALRHGMEL
jgi:hypothetical protein